VSFFLSLLRKDAWVDEDIVFLIIIIIIQTRILRLLSLPLLLEKKRVPSLEEEDAFITAKRFSGTKYIRKQRGDDHQNHF
jgi:NhaP-type Na+/H+ or K+/H+ antiporter